MGCILRLKLCGLRFLLNQETNRYLLITALCICLLVLMARQRFFVLVLLQGKFLSGLFCSRAEGLMCPGKFVLGFLVHILLRVVCLMLSAIVQMFLDLILADYLYFLGAFLFPGCKASQPEMLK